MKKETGMLHTSEKEERKQNKILHALYKKAKVNKNTKEESKKNNKLASNRWQSKQIKSNEIKNWNWNWNQLKVGQVAGRQQRAWHARYRRYTLYGTRYMVHGTRGTYGVTLIEHRCIADGGRQNCVPMKGHREHLDAVVVVVDIFLIVCVFYIVVVTDYENLLLHLPLALFI